MTDLAKTPSNRRYVVNFQNKEPKNKYDIWLSLNKHDLNGRTVVDSEYLADRDLVFKIWMNGKWVPILGIPVSYEGIIQAIQELDRRKMNIVPVSEFEDGHIPVFQHGEDDCDQLVDGGTLLQMLQTIINNGGVIPIQRASTQHLGGIKATTHTISALDQYIEAKFKGPQGPNDNDRLYLSASEIVAAINNIGGGLELQLMGPDTMGGARANYVPTPYNSNAYIPVLVNQTDENLYISGATVLSVLQYMLIYVSGSSLYQAGEGIDITEDIISNILATDATIGGIKADTHDNNQDSVFGIQPKFGTNGIWDAENPSSTIDEQHLCITSVQIYELLKKIDPTTFGFPIGTESGLYGRFENIGTSLNPEYIPVLGINGVDSNNVGKIPTVVASLSSLSGYDIAWIPIPGGGQTYDPLSSNSVYGTNYVVAAPQNQSGYLRWDGTFDNPPTNMTISPVLQTGTLIATYWLNGVQGDLYAPSAIYHGGDGIYIDSGNHINIDTHNAHLDYVLGYTNNGIEWIPQGSYSAGYGIDIRQDNTIDGMIDNDTNSHIATFALAFNCAIVSQEHPLGGVTMQMDNNSNGIILDPYTYTEVILNPNESDVAINFVVDHQMNIMHGNPVYVLLDIQGKPGRIIVSIADTVGRGSMININNALIVDNGTSCLDFINYKKFLVTIQFGIVRIEPLENTVSSM